MKISFRKISAATKRKALAGAIVVAVAGISAAGRAEEGFAIPAPQVDEKVSAATETAVFAGGCFWGIQGVFQHVDGVKSAVSGYAGGQKDTAHYEMVGTGRTGHAESVKVVFDPQKISYGKLLQIYFTAHDPTQLNRQGPDAGTQYRSAIFPQTGEQAKVANAYIDQLGKAAVFAKPVVTSIEPSAKFFVAEDYHQDFLANNPDYPYIAYVDMPKIDNLKRLFPGEYREKPVLVAATGTGN